MKLEEIEARDSVLLNLRQCIQESRTIPLDRTSELFSGCVGEFHYFFEGEDDLLHLTIERSDGGRIEIEETGPLARFLLPNVPEAMVWMRPGERSHHYYLGHELLLRLD